MKKGLIVNTRFKIIKSFDNFAEKHEKTFYTLVFLGTVIGVGIICYKKGQVDMMISMLGI